MREEAPHHPMFMALKIYFPPLSGVGFCWWGISTPDAHRIASRRNDMPVEVSAAKVVEFRQAPEGSFICVFRNLFGLRCLDEVGMAIEPSPVGSFVGTAPDSYSVWQWCRLNWHGRQDAIFSTAGASALL